MSSFPRRWSSATAARRLEDKASLTAGNIVEGVESSVLGESEHTSDAAVRTQSETLAPPKCRLET
jgi:hypothetical protein